MGLDWCLHSTIEGKSPLEFIGAEKADPQNQKHVEILDKIIKSHRDAIANGDGRDNEKYLKYWLQSDKVLYEDIKGSVLVDMVDPQFVKTALQSRKSMFSCLSGVEAFRGKRVGYCELLPQDLRSRAYEDMNAEQMLSYASELEAHIPKTLPFDYDTEAEKAEKAEKLGFDDKTIPEEFWDVCTLKEAVAWLRFWAQYPVTMHAWY